MRKKTSFEDAIRIYTEITGNVPEYKEIENLYHRYANCWKPYTGFADYLIYNGY